MKPASATERVLRETTRGFTLVEILLVLALLALGGAILLPSARALIDQKRSGDPEDVVATVLQQVRREAVLTGEEVVLRFEAGTQRFAWGEASVPAGTGNGTMRVDFLRPGAGNAVLIGGQLVETSVVPALRFFPDGSCDPVRVQVRLGDGPARVFAIDPWTCAPGLEVKP